MAKAKKRRIIDFFPGPLTSSNVDHPIDPISKVKKKSLTEAGFALVQIGQTSEIYSSFVKAGQNTDSMNTKVKCCKSIEISFLELIGVLILSDSLITIPL